MDDKRVTESRLRELADALRPASDDLSQPEFAELAERVRRDPNWRAVLQRSERLDLAVSDWMHDLAVPPGSVDRLLARLAAAAPSAVESEAPPAASTPPPVPARVLLRFSRRIAGAAVLATAAAIALVAYFLGSPSVALGPDEILQSLTLFAMHETAGAQHPLPEVPAPRDYPASAALAGKPVAWRKVEGLLDRSGVAYVLRAAGAQATLYVLDAKASPRAARLVDLPASPPPSSMSTTGGHAMAAWMQGKLAYLLIVDGGAREYQAFVAQPGQLASRGVPGRMLAAARPPRSAFSANSL